MKTVELQQVATIIAGQSPESSTYNSIADGVPFFQGKTDFQEKFPKVRIWCNSIKRKEAEPGDILMSVRAPVGSVNICNQKCIIGRGLSAIRPHANLNNYFLYYYLKFNEKYVASLGTGSTFKAITQETLKRVEIPFPPLDDQIRIATLLSKVENLISRRREQLKQLDELLKSVFLEMFCPVNQLFDTWPIVEIKELAAKHKGAMRTGPFGSNLLHSEFSSTGDVAVMGIDNAVHNRFTWGDQRFITKEKYKELGNYTIFPGDVIITIMGTIGCSAVIPDDIPLAINTKHLAAITLDRELANPLFLSYSIHSNPYILKQFKSKNRGAIMGGLNLTIIKETKIRRPPIQLQNHFAGIHGQVDGIKSSYQQSLIELNNLYGALSQKAFKGELDLSRVQVVERTVSQRICYL
ncbi:MAG: restriction endonuclease subunit S [Desulfobulbaceae bacterium]|nr:restriction endonuclease subunit S [Desulfobulbaceae bacterium]